MTAALANILVVDDSAVNRRLLERALANEGYAAETAADGLSALDALQASNSIDAVLLDLVMPGLDGYEVLTRIKHDPSLRHLPVIVITGVDEIDSIVRCVELGAADYLPKPFNPALLRARLGACLAEKRLRDLEREYLEEVGRVTAAAAAVESGAFALESLDRVVERPDALGQLARVFQRMAHEVQLRERRLQQQLQQVLLDMEERRRAESETISAYIPMDRRHALASGESLPLVSHGAALFVDVSGFTSLATALARDLGLQRGAEELIRHLNRVFDGLIESLHRYRGSAIGFAGDAMTCWFADDDGRRATASAFAMLDAMRQHGMVTTPAGASIRLSIKVAVVAGSTRRYLVGDPTIQLFEVLAGNVLDELARAERLAGENEVLVDLDVTRALGDDVAIIDWREHPDSGARFAVIQPIADLHEPDTWPPLPAGQPTEELARPWLAGTVFERIRSGKTEYLAELRPVAALFLSFKGIAYEEDVDAGSRLDSFIRWVQSILARYGGTLLQITIGDKGSYLYAAFGAPVAHEDDPVRAVAAALELKGVPRTFAGITVAGIGVAYGQMRAGAYGGTQQRTYGVQGDKTNLAAYLMQRADGKVLCDEAIHEATHGSIAFEPVEPIHAKGGDSLIPVFRPTSETLGSAVKGRFDRLTAEQQVVLKVASVIGSTFSTRLLNDVYPMANDRARLRTVVNELREIGMLVQRHDDDADTFSFLDSVVRNHAYHLLLFAQRRQIHRSIAEWHEREYRMDLGPVMPLLADHWLKADEPAKAIHYLEQAGQRARQDGAFDEAERFFRQSLLLESQASVLSADFYATQPVTGASAAGGR